MDRLQRYRHERRGRGARSTGVARLSREPGDDGGVHRNRFCAAQLGSSGMQSDLTRFRIRPAVAADCDALLALYCEVHELHVKERPEEFESLTPEEEAALLREFASTEGWRLHVAETAAG